MKFLPETFTGKTLAPLNYIYHKATPENGFHDCIDIIFKDIDTDEKFVHSIEDPVMEVAIVKEEYRSYITQMKDYYKLNICDMVKIHFARKDTELAKLLKIPKKDVPSCPYIAGSDIDPVHYYAQEFVKEYYHNKPVKLNAGFLDIENDSMFIDHFPEPGEIPTNAVTYIDGKAGNVYTLLLRNPSNPLIAEFEEDLDGFIQILHEKFDDNYGVLKYHILMFDDELEMYCVLFNIIRECNNDIVYIWNLGYDMPMITQRIINLGGSPQMIMCDNEHFNRMRVAVRKDNNPVAHKRKHICTITMLPYFKDQLVEFAGVRSAGKKLPMKLNFIARKILHDEKYDFSEIADIKTIPYKNYKVFVIYNIKDVLLQLGIYRKVKDCQDVYQRCYTSGIPHTDAFISTNLVYGAFKLHATRELNLVCGNNRNKLKSTLELEDAPPDVDASVENDDFDVYKAMYDDADDEDDEYENILDEILSSQFHHANPYNDANNVQEILDRDTVFGNKKREVEMNADGTKRKEKKKGFTGAIVLNPKRMTSTGYYVGGDRNTRIHEYVVDFDTRSEYPVCMILMNLSNETMIGKIYLGYFLPDGRFRQHTDCVMPIYNYKFIDDDLKTYHVNPAAILAEMIGQRDVLNIGTIYMNLPSIMNLFNMVNLKKILKGNHNHGINQTRKHEHHPSIRYNKTNA